MPLISASHPDADDWYDPEYVIELPWARTHDPARLEIGAVDNDAEMRIAMVANQDGRVMDITSYLTRAQVEELVTVLSYRLREEWVTAWEWRKRSAN